MRRVRGFLYWLVTRSGFAWLVGSLFGAKIFDRNGPLTIPEEATPQMRSGILFNVYEYSERYLVRRWLPRNADVVELGASIGIVSREILNRIDEQHRLFAVEAVQGLAQLAEANLARLHISSRWRVLTAAVAYNVHEVFFNADRDHVAGRIVGTPAQGEPRVRRVSARTLSSIIDQFDLSDYSLVMDIEGAEHELIAHEKEALAKCRCVIAELHGNPGDRDVFCQTLEAIGMRLVERKHSVAAFLRP